MIKIKFKNGFFLLGALMMSNATAANVTERIRSVFDINYSYCAIITNGVLGIDNRDSSVAGRGFGTASTNAMIFMENGQNDITVQMGALGWFDEHNRDSDEYKKFNSEAYCKLELTLFQGKLHKSIAKINVGINSDGYPYEKSGDSNVFTEKVMAPQVEEGYVSDEYFNKSYFPKNMELYQFTKKIALKGLPEWKWVKAEPFISSSSQIMALQGAYVNMWKFFATKDNAAIKELLKESSYAWSVTTGNSIDDVYDNENFVDHLKEPSFEMQPINWGDYKIVTYNKGRLVRFVNKSQPDLSPISYYLKDERGEKELFFFSPIFSIVNGKIIPVI